MAHVPTPQNYVFSLCPYFLHTNFILSLSFSLLSCFALTLPITYSQQLACTSNDDSFGFYLRSSHGVFDMNLSSVANSEFVFIWSLTYSLQESAQKK